MMLSLLGAFTVFSIYGAFIGAERAQVFFNSIPMVAFWCVLLVTLVVGFFVYVSLRKRSTLMLIHLGCILVLAGGMIGSEKGHVASEFSIKLSARFMAWLRPSQDDNSEQSSKHRMFTKGSITLGRGQSSDRMALETETDTAQLPFSIRLKEAYIEYYDKPTIAFYLSEEESYSILIEVGKVFVLPGDKGTVQIDAVYKNFKMTREEGQMKPYDSPEPGYNPAYELTYVPKDQPPQPFFVFEKFGMHAMPGQTFRAEYVPAQMVRDYKSTLQVVEDGEVVKEATIEVNKPLYYSGYHFYQSTFGYDHSGPISGIKVSSARGVWIVFSGYGAIFAGLIFQLWPKLFKKQNCPKAGERAIIDDPEVSAR